MSFEQSPESEGSRRLSRNRFRGNLERAVFFVAIAVIAGFDLVQLLFFRPEDASALVVSLASTLVLPLFFWSPLIGACAIALVFVFSLFAAPGAQVLVAGATAFGLVMRFGKKRLIWTYTASFLVALAGVAIYGVVDSINVGIVLVFATVAGAIGATLRIASARGIRLESDLEAAAEQERQAVLAERRWIAGELHDSIAHHLTVVSLHVQMLEDPQTSSDSQEAIRVAARKAMTDLRFVIELADDAPQSASVQSGDLVEAIDEAQSEFESAGHSVVRDGDPADERIPRAVEIVLARIVRESATNILKYAGPGEVEIHLDVDDEVAHLTLRSPLPTTPRRELSSSRTGLGRMAERVMGASGEFSAGEVDGFWLVSARLPVV